MNCVQKAIAQHTCPNTGDRGYGRNLPEAFQDVQQSEKVGSWQIVYWCCLVCIVDMSWQKLGSTGVLKLQKNYAQPQKARTSNVWLYCLCSTLIASVLCTYGGAICAKLPVQNYTFCMHNWPSYKPPTYMYIPTIHITDHHACHAATNIMHAHIATIYNWPLSIQHLHIM